MQFYARKVLERHKLWDALSAGKECVSCQTTPTNWFTAVHHRETPERIRDGRSDVGIVWKTEVMEAVRDGAPIQAVELPVEDSLRDEVSYVIGILAGTPHFRRCPGLPRVSGDPCGSRCLREVWLRQGFSG